MRLDHLLSKEEEVEGMGFTVELSESEADLKESVPHEQKNGVSAPHESAIHSVATASHIQSAL